MDLFTMCSDKSCRIIIWWLFISHTMYSVIMPPALYENLDPQTLDRESVNLKHKIFPYTQYSVHVCFKFKVRECILRFWGLGSGFSSAHRIL